MSLEIHLLGPPRVVMDGAERPSPRGHKVWALLGLLILSAAPLRREHIAGLLFSDADDPLGSLRWNLAQLRRLLGPEARMEGDPVTLRLPADARIDVRIVASGTWVEARRLPGLGRELLEGVDPTADAAFEAWLLAERRRHTGIAAAILREAATASLASGDSPSAVELATRLVALDGYDEEAQALLVRAHVASGNVADARRYLSSVMARFRRELGVEPSSTLVRAAEPVPGGADAGRLGRGRAAIESLIAAGEAAVGAGAIEAGLETLRRAVADAREPGEPVLHARALVALGTAYIHGGRGRDGEGATALHAALAIGQDTDARDVVSEACRELGYVEMLRARYDRAEMWLRRALDEAPDGGTRAAAVGVLGSVTSDRGRTADAIALLSEAVDVAERLRKPRLTAWAYTFLGRTHLLRDERGPARVALDRAMDSVRAAGWMTFLPLPQSLRATADIADGRVDEASEAFEAAFALGCEMGDPCWEGMGARGVGLVRLARKDLRGAVSWLDDARTRCLRVADAYLWVSAYCLDALCEVAIANDVPGAVAWARDLQNVASRTGMMEMLVRAQLHLAALGQSGELDAGQLFAAEIDNPAVLRRLQPAASAA